MNCKHCGSKYIEEKEKTEEFGKITYKYYCQSCKKTFEHIVAQNTANGQWLITLRGNESFRTYDAVAEIHKKSDGTFEVNQKDRGKVFPVTTFFNIRVEPNDSHSSYYLWYSSWRSRNDPNGFTILIEEIELNPELTEKALNNDAMKALYYRDNIFRIKRQTNAVLLNDVVAWLRTNLGLSQTTRSGCYIATCVYGSYDCPEVWTLRRFRDNTLAASFYGRAFIKLYYAISPTLVKIFGDSIWFRKFWRKHLDRAVNNLNAKGVESTRYIDKTW